MFLLKSRGGALWPGGTSLLKGLLSPPMPRMGDTHYVSLHLPALLLSASSLHQQKRALGQFSHTKPHFPNGNERGGGGGLVGGLLSSHDLPLPRADIFLLLYEVFQ